MSRVTLEDVARESGLSYMTAVRAFRTSPHSKGTVSLAVGLRVMAAAERIDYRPRGHRDAWIQANPDVAALLGKEAARG